YESPRRRFPLRLGDDLFRHMTRGLFIARKMHRVLGASLRAGTHMRRVPEHLRQRNDGLDDLRTGAMLHAFDASATRTQVTHDGARVIFRRHYFDRHHRLQNHRARLACRFFESHRAGNLKRHFVRIDVVIAAVEERRLDVDHRIARKYAAFHSLLHALVDRLDEFLRYGAAHDFIDEFVAFARLVWIEINLGVPVLAAAAGLANVFAFRFGMLPNGLAIRDLRLADVRLNLVFAHHAVDDDFEMQLAHAADDRLPAIRIGVNFKSRIFLCQPRQRHTHLFLIGLGLRFDRNRNYRHRKHDRLERDRMLLVADGVARTDVSEADYGADVPGENFLNIFALIGVHLEQAPNALMLLRTRVHHRFA